MSGFAKTAEGIFSLFLIFCWASGAGVAPSQGQLVSVAIVPFHDASDAAASSELLHKIGQEFSRKLTLSYRDVLPRLIGGDALREPATAGVSELAAIGKQQGARFVVRGGILAMTSERSGQDLRCGLELFADVVDTATLTISSLRAAGEGVETGQALEDARRWDAYSWDSPEFARSALGQAMSAALGSLADQVHVALTASASEAAVQGQGVEAPPPVDPYQADQELQQLMAQAESLVSSGAAANIDVSPLQQSLEGTRTAMNTKLELMQQAQDTTAVDQELGQRREELGNLVNAYTQQVAANPQLSYAESFSGGKPDALTRINGLIEGTLSLLQKIQEIRLALRGSGQEQGYVPSGDQYAGADQYNPPTEEETAAVSGVVTDDGIPVGGATVFDPETGMSAATDSNGSYTLSGLPGGRIANLQVSRAGKTIAAGRVELRPGQAAISDWTLRSGASGLRSTASPIIPSSLIAAGLPGQADTGNIQGVVRDGQGRPVPRAAVSVKGVGTVRTDSQGRYKFLNVPQGGYQVTVQQAGGPARTQQVKVGGRQTLSAPILYQAQFPPAGKAVRPQALTPGENTLLKGRITEEKNRTLEGAKVTVIYPGGALKVYSNSGGVYQLRSLKPGDYRVLVSKPGYDERSQSVTLRSNAPAMLDFQLKQTATKGVQQALASQRKNQAPTVAAHPSHPPAVTKTAGKTSLDKVGNKTEQKGKEPISRTAPKTREQIKSPSSLSQGRSTAAIGPTAAAVENGGVHGTVTDGKTRAPVSGASVSLRGKPSTQTDGSGRYSFSGVAPGVCSVNVRKSGYKNGGGSVTVKSGQTATADFSLTKQDIVIKKPTTTLPIKKQD
jgi:protocatechuate 3,4-dioxygenase beta subunit